MATEAVINNITDLEIALIDEREQLRKDQQALWSSMLISVDGVDKMVTAKEKGQPQPVVENEAEQQTDLDDQRQTWNENQARLVAIEKQLPDISEFKRRYANASSDDLLDIMAQCERAATVDELDKLLMLAIDIAAVATKGKELEPMVAAVKLRHQKQEMRLKQLAVLVDDTKGEENDR